MACDPIAATSGVSINISQRFTSRHAVDCDARLRFVPVRALQPNAPTRVSVTVSRFFSSSPHVERQASVGRQQGPRAGNTDKVSAVGCGAAQGSTAVQRFDEVVYLGNGLLFSVAQEAPEFASLTQCFRRDALMHVRRSSSR